MSVTELRPFENMVERVLTSLNMSTSGVTDPEQWLIDAIGGGSETAAGVKVNARTALAYPPVYYAVNKIAGHTGTLPLKLRRRDSRGRGSQPVTDHPMQRLIDRPTEYCTGQIWRETLTGHALLHGNATAAIWRDGAGTPLELIPVLPESTFPFLHQGKKYHHVITPSGAYYSQKWEPGRVFIIDDADMFHVPAFGHNAVWGLSLIDLLKEALGLGIAGQVASAHTMANQGKPGVILIAPPGKFRDPKKAAELVEAFDAKQQGLNNAGRTALLREGVTAQTLPISASDAQFLEQRGFQRQDTALMFLLETIIGDNSGQTYKSISERNAQYLVNCLSRWTRKYEHECDEKLLTEQERAEGLFWRFEVHMLLEGDPNSLADYTGKLRVQGAVNGNDVREMHHLSYVDDPQLQTYSNPNTTTSVTESRSASVEVEESSVDLSDDVVDNPTSNARRDDRVTALLTAAVTTVVTDALSYEKKRVREAVRKKDRQGAVNKFYNEWGNDFNATLTRMGCDVSSMQEYYDSRRDAVLNCQVHEREAMFEEWMTFVTPITEAIIKEAVDDV